MAEVVAVVSLIASVVSIIDGIGKTKILWKKYVQSSTLLRAELLPILGKLTAFAGILHGIQLQCELDEADSNRLHILSLIEQPLKASEEAVRLIAARIDQVISLGRVSLSFGKVLNKDTTRALHVLDQAKSVLDLALAADQITLAKSIETYIRNVARDLRDLQLESNVYYQDIKGQLRDIKAKADDDTEAQNKTDILAWISQTDYSSNYKAARQPTRRDDTSGNWFIASDGFQDWLTDEKHTRILLTGISGSGKTVLCAKAVDHLAQRKAVSGLQSTILYHFFDFNDAAKESVEGMIRSLLSQLLLQLPGVPKDVQVCYEKQQGSASAALSTQVWTDLFCTQMHTMQDVFILIDALDECTDSETDTLSETLERLFSEFQDNARWLTTCRPNIRAINDLQRAGFCHIEMTSETVDRDIETYLTACLKSDARFSSYSNNAKQCIISGITSKSSGMFRYAQCQLESVAKLRDRRITRVKEILQSMPRTISESYHRILSDAQQLDDWPLLERILLLVSFSTRPITVAEVSEFAILEHDTVSLDSEDRLDISDILTAINTMITVREDLVTLAHKSVRDFFEAGTGPLGMSPLWQGADTFIAIKCLQYLRILQEPVVTLSGVSEMKEPNTTQLKSLLRQYPFLDYAATRWSHHVPEKQQQQEVIEHLASTLPLSAKPNLWKAWLLLQRADIWENQIQLAGILCEAFIRGALVTNWSLNFWQHRQHYRVRNGKHSQNASEPLLILDMGELCDVDGSSSCATVSCFWATAIESQSPTHALPTFLGFETGDLIFILEKGIWGQGTWWQGIFNGQTGAVASHKVERCRSYLNHRLSGQLFHELSILLLEIAFQKPLAGDAMMTWTAISSAKDLMQYLGRLKELTRRASNKMGSAYCSIVKQCLSHVHWLDDNINKALDVLDLQESCMETIHKSMLDIQASGFRASRRPVKRLTGSMLQARYGDYISNTTSGPLSTDHQYGSVPIAGYARALSRTAVISQTAAYHSAALSTLSYRPYSTSAVATGHSSLISACSKDRPVTTDSRQIAQAVRSAHPSWQAPVPTSSQASWHLSVIAPAMATVMESRDETVTSSAANAIDISKITANDTSAYITYSSTGNGGDVSRCQHLLTDTINVKHLLWSPPDHLEYHIFSEMGEMPEDIQPSDVEVRLNLLIDRAAVEHGDSETRLAWACSFLDQETVLDGNGIRAARALSIPRQSAFIDYQSREDAIRLVTDLADQGYSQAVYTRATWWESGMFNHEVDKVRSLQEYLIAADVGHANACYRAALLLKADGQVIERDMYYARAVKTGSAGALYRQAMSTMQGANRERPNVRKGMSLLLKAAEMADAEVPQALYVAGLMFAHEQLFLNNADNPVPPDDERAVAYFRRAAQYGSAKAQLRLGTAYELAQLGLPFSIPLALHYYILAARRGEAEAEMAISKIVLFVGYDDVSQKRPYARAAYIFAKRAALDDLPVAQFALGCYHEMGIHVAVDMAGAIEWYEKAAAQGNDSAIERLAHLQNHNRRSQTDIADNSSEKSWQADRRLPV